MNSNRLRAGGGVGTGVAPGHPIVEVHRARARARQAGFTLVELMVVVAMIMVIAALVAPSLSAVQGDARQQSAAVDLVRLSRRARAITMRSRVVHMLRFLQTGANGHGTIAVFAGLNNRCGLTDWDTEAFTNHAPVELFDMLDFNPGPLTNAATDLNRQVITLRGELPIGTAVSELRICYQPDGQTYAETDIAPGLAPQAGGALFTVARAVPGLGGARGVPRQVLFPAGGTARIR